jgi:calcineurin-like phosphoesterase family protein
MTIDESTRVISDTHFYHPNTLKYELIRFKTMLIDGFEDSDILLIHRLNHTDKVEDTGFVSR